MSEGKEMRGRKEIDLTIQIKELFELNQGKFITVSYLAEYFNVCRVTIVKNIKKLKNDGYSLVFCSKGYKYIDKISSEEDALIVKSNCKWSSGVTQNIIENSKKTNHLTIDLIRQDFLELSESDLKKIIKHNSLINLLAESAIVQNQIEDMESK
jgi:biotin operon repressor